MKRLITKFILPLCLMLVVAACQKEFSFEGGNTQGAASGTLLDSSGNCKSAVVMGKFVMDTVLSDSNYILVNVNFTSSGKYMITTDTVNGMWFVDSGYVLSQGAKQIKLKGHGTPILPNAATFVVSFNGLFCGVTVLTGYGPDYLPTSAGSAWTYQYIPHIYGGSTVGYIDTFQVSAIAANIPYNNKVYFQYPTSLKDTFYYARSGFDYYEFGAPDFDYSYILDQVSSFQEYIYLKDNQPPGTSWESPEFGSMYGGWNGGVSKAGLSKAVFTIMSVGQTYTVAGQVFKDVIIVKRDLMFQPTGGTYSKVMDGLAYYAKGYGLIDQSINMNATSVQNIPLKSVKIN